jgi:hypothetical protein
MGTIDVTESGILGVATQAVNETRPARPINPAL